MASVRGEPIRSVVSAPNRLKKVLVVSFLAISKSNPSSKCESYAWNKYFDMTERIKLAKLAEHQHGPSEELQ